MSDTKHSDSTSQSTYRFWRSQHRPMDDAGEKRSPQEIISEATCNRFGEEMGQRLEGLVWPEVPEFWKNLAGKLGGRVAPLYLLAQRIFGSANANQVLEHQPQSSIDPGTIQAKVRGLLSDPDWKLTIISNVQDQNPEAEGDALRDLVIKRFAARVLEEIGLSGGYKLNAGDPQSINYVITLLIVAQELNQSEF